MFVSTRRSLTRPRALIVDDDALHLRAAARALQPYADVVAASSGESALQLLQRDAAFDLVLCDVLMDRMSGLTLRAIVQRDNPALGSRIVLISSEPAIAGDVHCLAKPLCITKALALLAAGHAYAAPHGGPAQATAKHA